MAAVAAPAVAALTASRAHADRDDRREHRREFSHVALDFVDIRRHENAHVQALLGILGSNARPKPTFQHLLQRSYTAFVNTSQALENTGVGAIWALPPRSKIRHIWRPPARWR